MSYSIERRGNELVVFRADAGLERRLPIVGDAPALTAFGFPEDLDGRPMTLSLIDAGFVFSVQLGSAKPGQPMIAVTVRGTCERKR